MLSGLKSVGTTLDGSPKSASSLREDNTADICPPEWRARGSKRRCGSFPTATINGRVAVSRPSPRNFETDCEVFLVCNGTAANARALAQFVDLQPYLSRICAQPDGECGAPDFLRGAKILRPRDHGSSNSKLEAKSAPQMSIVKTARDQASRSDESHGVIGEEDREESCSCARAFVLVLWMARGSRMVAA